MAKKINLFFDHSPTKNAHQYRGIGVYTKKLLQGLKQDYRINLVSSPEKADLIHLPYFSPFIPLNTPDISKTIITVHDLVPIELPKLFPQGLRAKFIWWQQKLKLKQVRHIITDSQASKKQLIKHAGISSDNLTVIPLATDIAPSKKPSSIKNLPSQYVLYVGDINPNKNIRSIVKACLENNLPLLVAGQAATQTIASTHPELQDLIWLQQQAKQFPKKVKLLGFVSSTDLSILYQQALAYFHPSFAEGFGLPVLEALKLGCPVITSNLSSLPEVVGQAAILVDPYSQSAINQALKKVINFSSVQRQKFITRGKTQAKKFSWQKTVNQTIKAYQPFS